MTFIPNILTKNDDQNSTSTTGTSFTGTGFNTTGFNTILITLESTVDSDIAGLEIQFSSDNSTWTTYYSDSYLNGTQFIKSYKIIDEYYRINYSTPTSTFSIISRLSTQFDGSSSSSANDEYNSIENGSLDAFGKLRVTNPNTLLDIKFPSQSTGDDDFLSNNYLTTTKESGTGTFIITNGESKKIMSITGDGTTNNYISQSRKYCTYQPGKSQLILLSGIIQDSSATSTNYQNSIGYFDDSNGLFFHYNANGSQGMSINLRNESSDTQYLQANWNIDKMDGTGNSGFNLNFTKSQLYVIDFEWLSVGRIRFGFYILGKIYYCHQITNINVLDSPYMLTPNLSIRYEINVEDSNSAQLTQICSSVISEGGYNPIGKAFSVSNGITLVEVSSTETPLVAIRGSDTTNVYHHENIIPTGVSVLVDTNSVVVFRLRLYLAPNSPSVTSWTLANEQNSVVQFANSGITLGSDNSIIVQEDYLSDKSSVVLTLENVFNNLTQITSNIDNVSDVLVLTAQKVGPSTVNVYGAITWQEIY